MKQLRFKKFTLYVFLTTLLALAQSSTQKFAYLQLPGGAIFKNPKKIVVPDGKAWVLTEDTHLQIDRLEIYGTIYTRGNLFSVYAGKLVFGPKGSIKTFDKAATDSLVQLPVPATPLPRGDQPKSCTTGLEGIPGTGGNDGIADALTDGRKDPQPIKIFAAELEGVAHIESVGQKAGKGMKGGTGGKGGQGGKGGDADADEGFFGLGGGGCDGGTGGTGGKGGTGGRGGIGGIGGPAPLVEFTVANIRTEQIFADNIFLREGEGGTGGDVGGGGDGGEPGAGGGNGSAAPITQSFWGNSANGGAKGAHGDKGDDSKIAGVQGSTGPVPGDNDRVLADFKKLDDHRRLLFSEWQEFHWRRHLLAHVQDSFRLIQKKIFTREQLKESLDADKALFEEFDRKQLNRIVDSWEKAFIAPLEDTLKTEPKSDRIAQGLATATDVVKLLKQVGQQVDLTDAQKKLDDLLYGDEGILNLNQKQIDAVVEECVSYNNERLSNAGKFEHIGLYFKIPSCEGEPDFRKKENLNADIILADVIDNDIRPKSLEESLRKEGADAILSKLEKVLFPVAWAGDILEHPLLSIKLVPFSVRNVELGKTVERDEIDLGLLNRLRMREEKEIWSNNFYQELRAFAVMTGAKL